MLATPIIWIVAGRMAKRWQRDAGDNKKNVRIPLY